MGKEVYWELVEEAIIVHWKLDWRLYIESPRHRCLIDFHYIALWPIQFTALPDKQNKAYKQPYKETLTFLFPFFPPLKRGDLVLLPPLELHVQRRSATTSKAMAMSLRSLLLISFLIFCYFYPSFALNIASIVFFTPVILLFMYLSIEHFVFLMTYLRQHEARVQNPLPRVVYVRERTNNTERALQCVLSEVWLYIVRAWTAYFFCMSFILLIYGMVAVVLYYPFRPFLWDCSVDGLGWSLFVRFLFVLFDFG